MKTHKKGHRLFFESDAETAATVSRILLDLEKKGMDAVKKYSRQFDGWDPDNFEIRKEQIQDALDSLDEQALADTRFCQENVRRFAKAQLETLKDLEVETQPGVILGHKHIPIARVGSYIPGGRYPLFGSAQMSIIPAKVAGVEEVIACTAPIKGQGYFPASVAAMSEAGADRIFILGGIQALALMVFGMGVVSPVDMLCGAGNKYVTEAKRQLFGRCGIDLLAGPSEILVIADDEANPRWIAADLLGQAEHDPLAGVALICFSESFAIEVEKEIQKQLPQLPTRDVAGSAWKENGRVLIAENTKEAIELSDDYAPEHLELQVSNPKPYWDGLRNYGSLFVGRETTVAYGDKAIGTNHILPTGRAARYTGGVWVGKFLKTCTYQRVTETASVRIAEVTERQCLREKMPGHAFSARLRIEKYQI